MKLAIVAIFFFGGIIISIAATGAPGWARVVVVWVPLAAIAMLVWSAAKKHEHEILGGDE